MIFKKNPTIAELYTRTELTQVGAMPGDIEAAQQKQVAQVWRDMGLADLPVARQDAFVDGVLHRAAPWRKPTIMRLYGRAEGPLPQLPTNTKTKIITTTEALHGLGNAWRTRKQAALNELRNQTARVVLPDLTPAQRPGMICDLRALKALCLEVVGALDEVGQDATKKLFWLHVHGDDYAAALSAAGELYESGAASGLPVFNHLHDAGADRAFVRLASRVFDAVEGAPHVFPMSPQRRTILLQLLVDDELMARAPGQQIHYQAPNDVASLQERRSRLGDLRRI